VTLEEDAKVGISRSINVWDNVVVEKRLVTATSAQANEGTPCCILAVDELYDVLRRKLPRHYVKVEGAIRNAYTR
jgi:hypothetical protein